MDPDGVEDPVAYTHGAAALLASTLTTVDAVFDEFLDLCDRAHPLRDPDFGQR